MVSRLEAVLGLRCGLLLAHYAEGRLELAWAVWASVSPPMSLGSRNFVFGRSPSRQLRLWA